MWWLGLLAVASALLWLAEDRTAKRFLRLYLAGLAVTQLAKFFPVGDSDWLVFAAIWTIVVSISWQSVATWRHAGFPLLTSCSVMCYVWGAKVGITHAPMVAQVILSDVFGYASLIAAGGSSLVGVISRNLARLADLRDPPRYLSGRSSAVVATQEAQAE